MRKITTILAAVIVCISCSQNKESNARFTDEQIGQLHLDSTQLFSVNSENSLKIDLVEFMSDKEISIDDLIDSIRYIPLQTTTKESLIAGIDKLIYTDDYVFILDKTTSNNNANVLIFSSDGTFIKKIPTGGGPQDISRPQDVAIDEEQGYLIVYNKNELSFYDYQGNFAKRELLPFYFCNFKVIPNGYLFVSEAGYYNVHLDELSDLQVLITDKNFRIISAGLPFHYSKHLLYSTEKYVSSLGKKVNFAFKYSDKIYQYVDTLSVLEKYWLDFSEKGIPNKYLKMSSVEGYDAIKKNNYYFFMGEYLENDTHESFKISNFRKKSFNSLIYRDKISGKLKGGNIISNINIIPSPLTTYKNEFIGALSGYTIFNILSELKKDEKHKTTYNRLNNLLGHLDEDANPVLIKYILKSIN